MTTDESRTRSRGLRIASSVVFITLGVVTALPVMALFEPAVLTWTYGVDARDSMTLALLQHRGVLQLALGGALVWAGIRPSLRVGVAAAAAVTKTTFLALLLPDPSLRVDLSAFSLWFDSFCILFFVVYITTALIARRRVGAVASANV